MIVKYTKGTEIKPGQYVNMDSVFHDGLCGRPRIVDKVSKNRIYLINPDYPNEGVCYKALESVKYICDTLEESKFLYECSEYQIQACNKFAGHVKEAIRERIESYKGN